MAVVRPTTLTDMASVSDCASNDEALTEVVVDEATE